ncbi:hypothetical protein BH09SUM1_BH09SUM1_06100 [soil metagenome]
MRHQSRWIFLLAAIAAGGSAPADILVLTDGARLEGRVDDVQGSTSRIAFTNGSGRIELPTSRIDQRIEEEDAQDWTRVGDQFAKTKKFTPAVQMYQRALEANPQYADAKAGLKAAQDAIAATQSDMVRGRQDALDKNLESIPKLIEDEKYDDAEKLLNAIQTDPTASNKQRISAQTMMRDLYLAWGFSRFDRMDSPGAEEKYLRVQQMDPSNKEARERLLQIWRNDPKKRPEVLKAYEAKLQEEPNNLEYNQAVGDMYYASERWVDSIAPLKKIASAPRYAGQGYDVKLQRAYQQSVISLQDQGKLDEAIKATEDMTTIFPATDPTNLLILKYERDKKKLAEDDYNGRALLAKKLNEAGLSQYAQREAQLVLRYSPDNEVANSILRAAAMDEYARIQEAFRNGDFLVARDMAGKFISNESRYADLIKAAEEVRNKADIEAKRQAKESRETAQQLAERGMEYYNEARRDVDLLTDRQQRSGPSPISYKQNAIKLSQRAIEHFETALRIDPTLGPITGMDLNSRLADARQLYNNLTDRPLPQVRNPNRRPATNTAASH